MKDSETEDAVASAVKKERREGEYIVERFREGLKSFEEKYDMETEEFIEKFDSGDLDDREDFFEWKSLYEAVVQWEKKIRDLKTAV
ncbi:hypothetical protein AKJ51_04070 [candidate division MSBL1 archaeon SCGC-AAA382A20]|uniref:Uncharacterized protein n=1 Tax=candidate division MSBL1 archaeon SCGC-AAA382A20 TaxID=1698280 RepID=A0A133VIB3_9EURY|nr:hypothetical protein AKJ51_04070 [candidate division MSBL1 archaeon SCGC-AAA382A20]